MGVILRVSRPVFLTERHTFEERPIKRLLICLIPLSLLTLGGCVVAPYPRPYYRAAIVAPAPVVIVRP